MGEAVTGEEAVEQFEALDPGLVLMDINLPGISGIEATRRITASHPDAVVLLLSTYRADDLPGGRRQLRRRGIREQGAVRAGGRARPLGEAGAAADRPTPAPAGTCVIRRRAGPAR